MAVTGRKRAELSIINRIKSYIYRYHRMRKKKDKDVSLWKKKWNNFNETRLGFLEHFVEKLIPWLVMLLFFIILGEFSSYLNVFHWHWMDQVAEFFHHNESTVLLIDKIIISFFVIDLYFNFFRKRTLWLFFKTSFLDILAVAPLGFVFRVSGLVESQSVLHVTTEVEKSAVKVLREGEVASKIVKAEEAIKFARIERMNKVLRAIVRAPRLLRLYRLLFFFKKKK